MLRILGQEDKNRRRHGIIGRRTMTLHNAEELDDDLRGRADEDLALATALGVDDVVLGTI